MSGALTDSLVVVNGPADGTAHALIRTRIAIGSGRKCDIVLIQDDDVAEEHAEVFSTSRGFRIRCAPGAAMRLNGARAGRLGSRLLRDGDIVQLGNTELMVHSVDGARALEMNGDGDAPRSTAGYVKGFFYGVGLVVSAFWYAIFDSVRMVLSLVWTLLRSILERRRLMMRLTVIGVLIGAYAFLPGIRRVVDAGLYAAAEYLKFAAESIAQLTGR